MRQILKVDEALVGRCRDHAQSIARGVADRISGKSSISVERSIARLLGIDGVDERGVPLPNLLCDHLKSVGMLGRGVWNALAACREAAGLGPLECASALGRGEIRLDAFPPLDEARAREALRPFFAEGVARIDEARQQRASLLERLGEGSQPWLYVIVATGNIYEDTVQARSAVAQGADIIAVIRTTAQSLLDYVPYGPTTEGFGGTYATQENFRIMRKAINEAMEESGRYVRLVNYASGLCMSEIAVTGAFEGLDMMLNDAMYGILFRDINPERTFIDQHFSRMINAYADIIINTGEDNYLTTADAVKEAHTVLASQFINEALARHSGLPSRLMGLGHAFEIDPSIEDSFLLELAQAQLVRQIFPNSPLKYMPPTKHMNGNIFRGHLMNGMFNLASVMSGQSIHLLGMMTEAVHTPFMHDRALAIENARHVFTSARHLGEELQFVPGGRIETRARQVLNEAAAMLETVASEGLVGAISAGRFADIARRPDGGKGADGIFTLEEGYLNPFMEHFQAELSRNQEPLRKPGPGKSQESTARAGGRS